MTKTHRVVEFAEYGGPEVLRVVERELPAPGPGQVLVAVRAAGVNPLDWRLRSGAVAEMMPVEFPSVPGGDVAGVVAEVGKDVTDFAVGDEVFGSIGSGSYAEFALAPAAQLARKPEGVSWEVAAGLPVAVNTAYQALTDLGVKSGETLVVDGAAGGVGSVAVQIARHLGATVIGTARERNHAYLQSLGAEPVTYGEGLEERARAVAEKGVDAALDAAGKGSLPALVELTGTPDRVVTIADHRAAEHGVRFVFAGPDAIRERLEQAAALIENGDLVLSVARTYSLSEAADAHRESAAGHVRGKLIILPD
ncbi:NADP-dependent oxidoreductase [Streptomyces sp. NBC_00893]|uniref:NADP-dependent oxidoreductase n=1 Tax=Streptomyces sp. NBC_00893 TaxID=2975862 RepID=UPI00224F3609|nr:NADP-dependent oxidoreductase [Streptomyces sp. NBC_00893]MCX4848318.1 NADP-dependent oxidoreductase [Streptomyces sp. NBC_00893]